MGPVEWTVIGTGIAVLSVNLGLFAWLKSDVAKLDVRERIARIEGKMDVLLQGLQIRTEPKDTA